MSDNTFDATLAREIKDRRDPNGHRWLVDRFERDVTRLVWRARIVAALWQAELIDEGDLA